MKRFLKKMLVTVMLFLPALLMTSCGDTIWTPGPPPIGWDDTFYDSTLTGRWELISADGMPVDYNSTNWMEFDGYGRGYYTYWNNGRLYSERLGYWCEAPYMGYSSYQINIQYEYSSPVTMDYWFSGNVLYFRWQTGSGRIVTYAYQRVYTIP
ncbi:MAG: hypothetical protein HDS73_04765 [Bacteroidales bacterium]|nr:hypothetical protein [Bacteroidales bacterium]